MNPFPPAALAVINAAIDDYRVITAPDEQTPAGLTDQIAQYLLASGYVVAPDRGRVA